MQIILIHGSGLSAISNKLSQIKKEFEALSITEISSKEMDLGSALTRVATSDLFSDKRLIILEDFEEIDLEKLLKDEGLTLVLKYSKKLAANSRILKGAIAFKSQVIEMLEREETPIFPFVDLLGDKNPRAYLEFEKYHGEWSGQYVLTMIFYLFRRLSTNNRKLPSFVLQKMGKQKRNFSKERIKELYKEGLELDYRIKMGLQEEKLGLSLLIQKILI